MIGQFSYQHPHGNGIATLTDEGTWEATHPDVAWMLGVGYNRDAYGSPSFGSFMHAAFYQAVTEWQGTVLMKPIPQTIPPGAVS